MQDFQLTRLLFFATSAFLFSMTCTPMLTHFLYKNKLGKRIRNNGKTPLFSKMHAHKAGTPTMGGILIWGTVLIFSLLFSFFAEIMPWKIFQNLNFLTQKETLLPLGVLVASALVGLVDDWLDVRSKGVFGGGGLTVKHRLLIFTAIATVGAWWFYYKLDWDYLHVPFVGILDMGFWYIFIFIFVIVATAFSVNETDGLDGLAGGTLLTSFVTYGVIAFVIGKYNLAVFCAIIVGALLSFLWFNVKPARFYMGDTGSMSLGVTLGLIALLTQSVLILPIIGFIFVIESLSVILQLSSKKLFNGKKIFLSAPIHHHFEAKGWDEAKIVMRAWIISGIASGLGFFLFLLDKTI